ncbi:MAG: hypothetical protein JOZ87_24785 [Chloroflexi bacterium]|nr:hypothetical protein [Chloroflexota bacterium]
MLGLLFFSWTGAPGVGNPLYLLLFGIGLVFPPRISWAFTAATPLLYAVLAQPVVDLKMLVVRLITLAAVCGLASLYWRSVRRGGVEDAEQTATGLDWQSVLAG